MTTGRHTHHLSRNHCATSSSKTGTVYGFSTPVNNRTPLSCGDQALGNISSPSKSMGESYAFIPKPASNGAHHPKADTAALLLVLQQTLKGPHGTLRAKVSRPSPLPGGSLCPVADFIASHCFYKEDQKWKVKAPSWERAAFSHLPRAPARGQGVCGPGQPHGGVSQVSDKSQFNPEADEAESGT